ncbi:MAG: phosphocholine cytidylyltransferase family protein [Planctomycetes bacterium]|nr:phosphocholine cytidylyltransferase family protein [Planctomycetota bacterium]
MRAIILAAGEGTRLRPHTLDRPKCLVELAGRSLLLRQVDALLEAGISDITVVTGYRADQVEQLGLPTAHNPRYDETNMVTSLMCAADRLDGTDDVIVAYGDIVYEPRIVTQLAECDAPLATTVDLEWLRLWQLRNEDPLADAETLRLDTDGYIVELGKKPSSLEEIQAQYMGLILIRAAVAPVIAALHRDLDPAGPYDGRDLDNMFMTSFLQHLIDHDHPIRAVPVRGGWFEVDTVEDLACYERLHAEGTLGEYCEFAATGAA